MTCTLELGIDVGDLDRVLQANAPSTVSSFLQRMGRTGRRPGQRANTLFLCEDSVSALHAAGLGRERAGAAALLARAGASNSGSHPAVWRNPS